MLVSLDAGLGHEIRNTLLQVVNPADEGRKLFSKSGLDWGGLTGCPCRRFARLSARTSTEIGLGRSATATGPGKATGKIYFSQLKCKQIDATYIDYQLFVVLRVHVGAAH